MRREEAETCTFPIRRRRVRTGNCSDDSEDSFVQEEEEEDAPKCEFKEGMVEAEREIAIEPLL